LRRGEQKRHNPPREVLEAILAILAVLSASIALAEDFKTINGKEYKNATVSRVEPDGIVLKTKSGISKVYFTEWPKDVQQRFQHDFAQGAHFTAGDNTASGLNTLFSNTTGSNNTADGSAALATNTTGFSNTATGCGALNQNSIGNFNTAAGLGALPNNTVGNNNTAGGLEALLRNTTGSNNIGLGSGGGANLTTGNNNIDIGNAGVAAESNTIRIGTAGTQTGTFIADIRGVPITGGQPIGVNGNGQLGVRASSARFKEAVKPMDKASEAILALRPVSFRYKKELDPKGAPQFGLVAEEVAKVNSDLVMTDEHGKPLTVRYDEVNAMLLNEFLKEHRKVEQLEATVASLVTTVKEQASEMQRVRAQLEVSKPAPQTVLNNR
jgi:hypothetical protein